MVDSLDIFQSELKDELLFQLAMLSEKETLILKISKIPLHSEESQALIIKLLGNNYLSIPSHTPLSVVMGLDSNYIQNWRELVTPLPNSLFIVMQSVFHFFSYNNVNLSFENSLKKYIEFRLALAGE
jgi:hypothetical protein